MFSLSLILFLLICRNAEAKENLRVEREQREIFQREQEEIRREKAGVIPTIAKLQNDVNAAAPAQQSRFKQADVVEAINMSRKNELFDGPPGSPKISMKQKSKTSLFAPPSPSNKNNSAPEYYSPKQPFGQQMSLSKPINNDAGGFMYPLAHGGRSPRELDSDNLVKKFQSEALRAQKEAEEVRAGK